MTTTTPAQADEKVKMLLNRIRLVLAVRKGDFIALGADVWEGGDGWPRSRPFTDVLCDEIDEILASRPPPTTEAHHRYFDDGYQWARDAAAEPSTEAQAGAASTPAEALPSQTSGVGATLLNDLRKRTERAGPGFHVALSYREMKTILAALSSPASSSPAEAEALPDGVDAVSQEWFERKAREEGNIDPTTGPRRSLTGTINPTPEQIAEYERLAFKVLPQWAQNEITRLRVLSSAPAVKERDE